MTKPDTYQVLAEKHGGEPEEWLLWSAGLRWWLVSFALFSGHIAVLLTNTAVLGMDTASLVDVLQLLAVVTAGIAIGHIRSQDSLEDLRRYIRE